MIEHELKFALSDSIAAEFDARANAGLTGTARRLVNRYYDTSAGELMNAGISLRIRQTPDGTVQTLKSAGSGPFERDEWERPVGTAGPERAALPPPGHPAGDRVRDAFTLLMPVFETDFERRLRRIQPEDGVLVEMACDRGEIRAGHRSEPIAEVELERRDGSAAAFYHFARQWAALHGARLLLPSKAERGLQLAGWLSERPDPARGMPATPDADATAAAAGREIVAGHLNHVLANLGPVRTGTDPEGPHQLRVGLRRLRAAIRFLDLADGAAENPAAARWAAIDATAKALADAAGLIREVDVLEAGLLAELARVFPGDAALQVSRRVLQTTREQDRQALRATLDAAATTDFVLQTLVAIETLDDLPGAGARFEDVAARRLAALARRLRRRVRAARVEADWHRVRLAIKDLRYAVEACARLRFDRQPVAALAGPLARWQETLGLGQDLAAARAVAGRALAAGRAPTELSVRAVALIDGYRAFATRTVDADKRRKPITGAMERLIRAARSVTRGPSGGYHRPASDDSTADPPAPHAKDDPE